MPAMNTPVHKANRKLCPAFVTLASALALGAALTQPEAARADLIFPGQQIALSGTTYVQRSEVGGVVMADADRPFSIPDGHRGFVKGYLQDRVVLSGVGIQAPGAGLLGTGTYIFYQRIVLDPKSSTFASINAFSRSNFTSVTTDVDYRTDDLPGDLGSSTAQRSVQGDSIQFNLPRTISPGEYTDFHMILTNATSYAATGRTTLMGPGLKSVTLTTFQPTGVPQSYYTTTLLPNASNLHVNDRGQVSLVDASTSLPELWNPTVPNGTDGTIFSLPLPPGYVAADVAHINSNGWIAGTAYTQTGSDPAGSDPNQRACRWYPSKPNGTSYVVDTLPLVSGDTFSNAVGINTAGEVVGSGGSVFPDAGPELWAGRTVSRFTNVPYGTAYAINRSGEIAAEGDFLGSYQGFLWTPSSPNGATGTVTTSFSVGGANYTGAGVTDDVNDVGIAIGAAAYDSGSGLVWHGYLWAGNTITDMGAAVSPYAINNAATVVGTVNEGQGDAQPFLYRNGNPALLSYGDLTLLTYFASPGDTLSLSWAGAINNSEQILAQGYVGSLGTSGSLLLTPVRISSVSPQSVLHGIRALTLTLKGLGFLAGANVLWNATSLHATRVNSDELTVSVPASLFSSAGAVRLQVINPDGTYSSVGYFTVK